VTDISPAHGPNERLSESVASTHAVLNGLVEVGEAVIAEKLEDRSWNAGSAQQARGVYALFSKFVGEEHGVTSLGELKQSHLDAYAKFITTLHSDYGRSASDRRLSVAQLRAIALARPAEKQGLSIPTRNRHLAQLDALLTGAEKMGEVVGRSLTLTHLRSRRMVRVLNGHTRPSGNQVEEFFRSPVFVGCRSWQAPHEPGDQVFHRAAYFAPLLAYYQGMRQGEICGLGLSDFVFDSGAQPYLHVGANHIQRLKNPPSSRHLVLHPELIRLGFIEYVEAIIECGQDRVFPDLVGPGNASSPDDRLSRELVRLYRSAGFMPHQFRQLFNEELTEQGVPAEVRAGLMGRGINSLAEYPPVEPELQMEALLKLPVRTARIARKPIQLLPWVSQRQIAPWSRAHKKS
jgi:integrase